MPDLPGRLAKLFGRGGDDQAPENKEGKGREVFTEVNINTTFLDVDSGTFVFLAQKCRFSLSVSEQLT